MPQAQFQGQLVLIGVDDMDLFKGIELKLQALERVLDHHAEWRGRLVLVQVTNPPRHAPTPAMHLAPLRMRIALEHHTCKTGAAMLLTTVDS